MGTLSSTATLPDFCGDPPGGRTRVAFAQGAWGCPGTAVGALEGAPPVGLGGGDALARLRSTLAGPAGASGRWVGWLGYGVGREIEPAAGGRPGLGPSGELVRVGGVAGPVLPPGAAGGPAVRLRSERGRAGYTGAVRRVLDYIRAGDVYQANIAHRLTGTFSGDGLGLFARLCATARPLHGVYLESECVGGRARAILSLSPELFLRFDGPTRRLEARPMKGTRPGDADPRELRDAPKDRAELAMIVDLMRNDLGRVCEFGSVRVERAREIERHATGEGAVLQATATVSGVVREGLDAADVLRATFPPGSVTGAPKIRAMQIIEELEGFERGPYCGCLGTFSDDGSFELSVGIRTAVISGPFDPSTREFRDAEFSYPVGAGVVADSDPDAEWLETLAKARVLEPACELLDI